MDIRYLLSLCDSQAAVDSAPQHTFKGRVNPELAFFCLDFGQGLTAFHHQGNALQHLHLAGGGGKDQMLEIGRIAHDTSVALLVAVGVAFVDQAPQIMAAHGLHHHIYVPAGAETGPQGNRVLCHLAVGIAHVPVPHQGIHHYAGFQFLDAFGIRVLQHHQFALLQALLGFFLALGKMADHPFHLGLAVVHCIGEGNPAAGSSRLGLLQHQNPETGLVQAIDSTGGKLPSAADNNQTLHICNSLEEFFDLRFAHPP